MIAGGVGGGSQLARAAKQLQKLRSEIVKARELVELTKKRDRLKKETLLLDVLIFEQKLKVRASVAGGCARARADLVRRETRHRGVWPCHRSFGSSSASTSRPTTSARSRSGCWTARPRTKRTRRHWAWGRRRGWSSSSARALAAATRTRLLKSARDGSVERGGGRGDGDDAHMD